MKNTHALKSVGFTGVQKTNFVFDEKGRTETFVSGVFKGYGLRWTEAGVTLVTPVGLELEAAMEAAEAASK